MEYINFIVSQEEGDNWSIQPQCHPGGPWEPDDGVTVIVVYKLKLELQPALAFVRQLLQPNGVDWLVPVTAVTGDWALDLDGLKAEFPKLLNELGWLRGKVVITPEYEIEQLGGVPPQLADVIHQEPCFVTRVRFSVTPAVPISAKQPNMMGKIGFSDVNNEKCDWTSERPPLEEMCSGPIKFVPVATDDLSPEARDWFEKEQLHSRYPGPRSWKAPLGQYTVRFIWNRIYARPKDETFHQFILYVLSITLGKNWYEAQSKLPSEDQHIIIRWSSALKLRLDLDVPTDAKIGERFELTPTSEIQELLVLADDIDRLQLVQRLPRQIRTRLRSYDHFQGARYEIAVAAMFVRCGFEIEWIDEKAVKHCEFVARHKVSGERIAVEAKSRVRKGALHKKGPTFGPDAILPADVGNLFDKALGQNPDDKPFAIFIDVNLPHQSHKSALEKAWVRDIEHMMKQRPEPTESAPAAYSLLALTNFAWHFGGRNRPSPGEFLFCVPAWSRQPIREFATIDALKYAVSTYGAIPADE